MKNRQQKVSPTASRKWLRVPVIARLSVVVVLALVGIVSMSQQVQAAQTPTKYCDQYARGTDEIANAMRNACSDGLKIANGTNQGMTCQDYETIYADQTIADICTKASEDRTATKNGTADIVGPGTVEATKSPSPSATPSATPNRDTYKKADIQNALDETKSLEDYIDVLHQSGPDAKVKTDEKDEQALQPL